MLSSLCGLCNNSVLLLPLYIRRDWSLASLSNVVWVTWWAGIDTKQIFPRAQAGSYWFYCSANILLTRIQAQCLKTLTFKCFFVVLLFWYQMHQSWSWRFFTTVLGYEETEGKNHWLRCITQAFLIIRPRGR